jgi:hypothetical protein
MPHSFTWHDLLRFGHLWISVLKWPRRWRKDRNENRAQGWPSIDGRITGGTVKPIPKTSRFHVTLSYIYFLDEYRVGQYSHEFTNEEDADTFVRQMKDKPVQIRYKQSKPDVSVLEQRVVEQHILLTPRFG